MSDLFWTGRGKVVACIPWRIAAEKVEAAVAALGKAEGPDVLGWQNRLGLLGSELQMLAESVHESECATTHKGN